MEKGAYMIKAYSNRNLIPWITMLFIFSALCIFPAQGFASPDYQGMVQRIDQYFTKALKLYKKGNAEEAKINAQDAYFKVFENLEGPIRINISAKKNYILEAEFSEIRDMIKNGSPYKDVEERIKNLMAEIRDAVSQLEGGYELKAEGTYGDEPAVDAASSQATDEVEIAEVWKLDQDMIQTKMKQSIDALKLKDDTRAQEWALQAYFNGYRDTLLGKAIKAHRSMDVHEKLVDQFMAIIGMIRSGESPAKVQAGMDVLLSDLAGQLPGLPVIRGAVAKAAPRLVTKDTIPNKDWKKIGKAMMADVDKAIKTYKKGDKQGSSRAVQSIYFDSFEATKLEVSIGVLDQELMLEMEHLFGLIIRGMEAGISIKEIREHRSDLNEDLKDALELLKKAKK